MLYLFHYEGALERAKHRQFAQHVKDEFLIVLHVWRMDFKQIVELARDVVALGNLGDVAHRLGKLLRHLAVYGAQLNATEHNEALVQLLGIENGYVPLYIAFVFEPLDALEHGGKTEVALGGNLLCCQLGILLQRAQNKNVLFVETFLCGYFFYHTIVLWCLC